MVSNDLTLKQAELRSSQVSNISYVIDLSLEKNATINQLRKIKNTCG